MTEFVAYHSLPCSLSPIVSCLTDVALTLAWPPHGWALYGCCTQLRHRPQFHPPLNTSSYVLALRALERHTHLYPWAHGISSLLYTMEVRHLRCRSCLSRSISFVLVVPRNACRGFQVASPTNPTKATRWRWYIHIQRADHFHSPTNTSPSLQQQHRAIKTSLYPNFIYYTTLTNFIPVFNTLNQASSPHLIYCDKLCVLESNNTS